MEALPKYIKAVSTETKKHLDELEQAIKYGQGAYVQIDSDTRGLAYKHGFIYYIDYLVKCKSNCTKVVYFSTCKKCMEYIAPLHEWRVIKDE